MSKVANVIEGILNLTAGQLVEFSDRAKMHPATVMDMVRALHESGFVYRIVKDETENSKKIQAIKHYRNLTGEGLKEAKDVVDGVRDIPTIFHIDIPKLIELLRDEETGYKVVKIYNEAEVR